jgi:lysocardiolipin and lysophospholipid acyltransferase
VKPTLWTALAGHFPTVVHIHITRTPINQFPKEKEEITKWCYDSFKEKDNLLDYFNKNGHFPRKSDKQAGKHI